MGFKATSQAESFTRGHLHAPALGVLALTPLGLPWPQPSALHQGLLVSTSQQGMLGAGIY